MRVDLKQLMDKLGVGYTLSPYETCPWSTYDAASGTTCSAEVRMNNDGDEVEAELQLLFDTPAVGQAPIEQSIWILCKPVIEGKWCPVSFRVRGQDEANSVYNWEEKCCNFFAACVQDVKMDTIPDIDAIMEREMAEHERFRGGRGGGGSKSPKIRPQQVLGMKNGRGF